MFSSKLAKLEFPIYSGNDPTEWFNRVDQFFEYQGTAETQKMSLASFHLQGEANQWWQWLRRAYKDEDREVTWPIFEEELWARFGPPECEDFDEALLRVRQGGSLREYQREFERLGNRVQGWTQKALVGTFMGGLKPDIAEGIMMFKPKSLKEAISLARMRDEQLTRQRRNSKPFSINHNPIASFSPTKSPAAMPMKRLAWDEMQKRRSKVSALIVTKNSLLAISVKSPVCCYWKGMMRRACKMTRNLKVMNLKYHYMLLLVGQLPEQCELWQELRIKI
jgi:hypothetical protein